MSKKQDSSGKRKSAAIIAASAFVLLALLYSAARCLYARKPMEFTFDAAYYWTKEKTPGAKWDFEKLSTGHCYYLYLPPQWKNDRDNESAKIPLIVVFHGSDEKGMSLYKYGPQFVTEEFQRRIHPNGAAVLVILSRINYFTDPHSESLLIQNIVLKNKCIDPTNIIGYGFSQGAKYVVELACSEPRLFRAVISGSGFYHISARELLSVLPVCFYSAVSEDDMGIFEQGRVVGKLCARWCKNSRYVQHKTRHHFWVELNDPTGRPGETVMDWLTEIAK